MSDTDQTPDTPTVEQPTEGEPTGPTTYYYEVVDEDGATLTEFTAQPEKVSDVTAVRLVRGAPLDDAVSIRQNGKPLAAFDVDRLKGILYLDRYAVDDDGQPVGDSVTHHIRLV